MAEPEPTDKSGPTAEQTELGQVVAKLLDAFDQMDLPESINDARVVIMIDTEREGTIAASPDEYSMPDVLANMFIHMRALLRQVGTDMEILSDDDLKRLMGSREAG